ncbi:hypothetical protein DB29_00874 [Shouchella clausii]|nr:hypothetical protein DB29_00874 [Shouchella clausii]
MFAFGAAFRRLSCPCAAEAEAIGYMQLFSKSVNTKGETQ